MSAIFPTYARWDITVKSGKGAEITDVHGKKYIDFTSGIGVTNLGHCHSKVTEQVKQQLDELWHVSNLYQIPIQEDVANRLVENSTGDYVFFCNSGAEANEAAIKLARKYTGKWKIISFKQSFHGRTLGSMAATGQEKIHLGYGPLLNTFQYATFNDLDSVKALLTGDVAAIMVEVIQGEGGVHIGDPSFLKELNALCEQEEILLIIDEVQTGIGRTGKRFAYEHFGLNPDIISVAKGLGNGFPVGAMIGKEKLKEAFGPGSHGSTFGGNLLAMAAAKATIDEIFQESFLEEVVNKGRFLMQLLKDELEHVSSVKEIRGKGLMIGIECDYEVAPILANLREKGLLVLNAGPNVIRLLPPLTMTKSELKKGVEILCSEFIN